MITKDFIELQHYESISEFKAQMYFRDLIIIMYKDTVNQLLSDNYNSAKIVTTWIDIIELVLYKLMQNERISNTTYTNICDKAVKELITLAKTFGCMNLVDKYIVD